jgi:hypothetical protein
MRRPALKGLASNQVFGEASAKAMPTIDLTDAELAAVAAAIRSAVEEDPRAPRLDPLRSALAKLDPAAADALGRRLARRKSPSRLRRWRRFLRKHRLEFIVVVVAVVVVIVSWLSLRALVSTDSDQ